MHRPISFRTSTLLLASLSLGCGTDAAPSPEVTRVDSAGREIVTSSAPAWGEGEGWTISAEPMLSIGEVEGEDPYNLFRVSDVMRLDDGRIVIANGGTREVRVFAADGTHERTVGGPGQGPGEFRYPSALLRRDEGGFSVVDFMSLEHFDAEGDHVALDAFDRDAWMELTRPLGPSEGGLPLGDGRVLAPIYGSGFSSQGEPRPGPPYRPDITMALIDPAVGSVDTIAAIGGILQQFVDVGPRVMPIVGPYAPSGRWFTGLDGSVVVYDGATAEVHRILPDGTHRILRWPAEPEPITDEEIEAWKERQRSASWAQDQLPQLERGWAEMDRPTAKAVVSGAHPSLDGSTWVRTGLSFYEARGPVAWQVFTPDGTWLGPVELPGDFRPFEITDEYVLGVERDSETEVETVRMFRLRKPDGR